jgi:DNA-binding transcriptional LysR family regulator
MLNVDLRSLKLFITVCEQQNITQAARLEHIEPSAISKRIGQLEETLGAQLLNRTRRGVLPTPAGQVLLDHARTVLFDVERMAADVSAIGTGLQGQVRLLVSSAAIAQFLLDDVAAFMRVPEHQNIQVDIEQRASGDLVRDIREGAASLGVCWDVVDLGNLSRLAYRHDRLTIAVPFDHPLAARTSVSFEETLAFEHVGLPPTAALHAVLRRAALNANQTPRYRLIVSNLDTALRVVSARFGISVIPHNVGRASAAALGVVLVPLTDRWAHCQFQVCFRALDALAPATRLMTQFLVHASQNTHLP